MARPPRIDSSRALQASQRPSGAAASQPMFTRRCGSSPEKSQHVGLVRWIPEIAEVAAIRIDRDLVAQALLESLDGGSVREEVVGVVEDEHPRVALQAIGDRGQRSPL